MSHATASEDRVGAACIYTYGCGMFVYIIMSSGYTQMVNPIFNVNLGMSPLVIAWVMSLSRIWDAVTDPLMGSLTDNTRMKYGRRRPWIFVGAILGAISYAAIWWFPLGQSTGFYIVWLVLMSLFFYTSFTVFSVPYLAMGMELSPDYHERTRVVAVRTFVAAAGGFAAMSIYWFATLPVFENPLIGMRYTAIGAGVLILIFGIVAAIFPREHTSMQKVAKKQEKVGLLTSAKQTLRVYPFLIICGVTVIALVGMLTVAQLGFYINLYYLFDGDQSASAPFYAFGGYAFQVGSLCAIPLITWSSKKYGKRNTLIVFLAIALIGTISKWWLYTPSNAYLQIIPNLLIGMGFIVIGLLVNAMIPECCDYDEMSTGTRREGMFSAVYSWMFKLGVALALLLGGYMLDFSGFDVSREGGQTEQTLTWLRAMFAFIPAVSLVVAIVLACLYPITEAQAYETQNKLKQRHEAA